MDLLDGVIRDYRWGSTTAIPTILGRPPDGRPWAELWLGAHHSAPALVGSGRHPLDGLIAADPAAALGPEAAARFGSLPFLLKVLAAAEPLSLQAHPSIAQAEAGFDREDAAGIPIDAAHRCFRDRAHKPELICALTDFEALCGFRDPSATLGVLATVDTPALDPVRTFLHEQPDGAGLGAALRWLLTLPAAEAAAVAEPVVAVCGEPGPDAHRPERLMAHELGVLHPGDAGVVTALLLNHVRLAPGEALFLGAGNLHAYLRGTGVEIMASSDNVLRGGLTSKHVDVATLLEVVDTTPIVPDVQYPEAVAGVATYRAPVPEFRLQRLDIDGDLGLGPGPAIVLCIEGTAEVGPHTLDPGSALWLPAEDGPQTVSGRATLYRAGLGAEG